MAFQILSDLHLENPSAYDIFKISPKTPYLALLGDIGVVKEDGFFPFIESQLKQFQLVFFLLGNHEPYYSTWAESKNELHRYSASVDQRRLHSREDGPDTIGRFMFLDQTRYDLSLDVTVLGCTLFSHVSEAHKDHISFGLNDFYHVKDWTVEDHITSHKSDLQWLNNQVSHISSTEPHRKIVVFTHHSPVTEARAVDPRHGNSPLSSGFSTDLSMEECWRNPSVRLWAFGHTHFNVNYVEDTGKMVISNQRGYYFSQAKNFDQSLVVTV